MEAAQGLTSSNCPGGDPRGEGKELAFAIAGPQLAQPGPALAGSALQRQALANERGQTHGSKNLAGPQPADLEQ